MYAHVFPSCMDGELSMASTRVDSYGAASGTTPRQGCGKVPRDDIEWATYQSERRSLEIEIGAALTWKSTMKRTALAVTCLHE